MEQSLSQRFNELSFVNKTLLRGVALLTETTRIAHDHTHEKPRAFTGYAGIMLWMMIPTGVPGVRYIPVAIMYGLSRLRFNDWARNTNDRYNSALIPENLMTRYSEHFKEAANGNLRLNKAGVMKDAAVNSVKLCAKTWQFAASHCRK
jgi:hypothetical protein